MCFLFFFFMHETAYEMRISDWISDLCSSDLMLRLLWHPSDGVASLREMLDRVAVDGDPGVLAFLVDRVMRRRELGIGEGARRNGGDAGWPIAGLGVVPAPGRPEEEGRGVAFAGGAAHCGGWRERGSGGE